MRLLRRRGGGERCIRTVFACHLNILPACRYTSVDGRVAEVRLGFVGIDRWNEMNPLKTNVFYTFHSRVILVRNFSSRIHDRAVMRPMGTK